MRGGSGGLARFDTGGDDGVFAIAGVDVVDVDDTAAGGMGGAIVVKATSRRRPSAAKRMAASGVATSTASR